MKIYLDNNLGVANVEQEELTQDTYGYNILKVYIPNAVLTPYDTFTCYYGALLQNGRKVGWFAMEARTSSDADYEENYTLYKATLEQCVVSVEGKVYIGCQVLLGNSGNATLIKKNTAVVQFNVRKSVAINNDILVLDTDQTTTDVLESYKNLLENALTTYATKATTYTKTEVDGKLDLKADKSDTYTKQESDNKFAPKTTAVTHTGNQLKDYSGNNIYPNLDAKTQAKIDNAYGPAYVGKDTSTNILAKTSNQGIWIGSDTGNWYYWNGTQYADGGTYQATEIADGSITYPKLDDNLKKMCDTEKVSLSLTNATYYDYTTGARDTTATMSSALLNVSEGEEYLFSAVNTINQRVAGIMFFDNTDTMVSYLLPNAYNVSNYYFTIPSGVTKMGLSTKTREGMSLFKLIYKKSVYETVEPTIQSIINKTSKIVLIGDSITAGVDGTGYELSTDVIIEIGSNTYYRVKDTGYCWANLLKKYFEDKYPDVTIINNGISGMTTSLVSTNTRLNALIPSDTDLVICALGTNDRNNTKATIIENLQFLENYCKTRGIKCLLMNNKPCSNTNEASKSLHMEDISNILNKVSYDNNYEMIDIYTAFNEYCEDNNITIDSLLADGLHPNDNGYKVMFYLICKLLGIATPRKDATWFNADEI